MIYISGKNESKRFIIASFLEEIGLGERFKFIDEEIAVDKKFTEEDIVVFTSRGSIVSAMLTKKYCEQTSVILVSSSIDGDENEFVGCGEIIFIKKEDSYLKKIFKIINREGDE